LLVPALRWLAHVEEEEIKSEESQSVYIILESIETIYSGKVSLISFNHI